MFTRLKRVQDSTTLRVDGFAFLLVGGYSQTPQPKSQTTQKQNQKQNVQCRKKNKKMRTELYCNECQAETEQIITREINNNYWQSESMKQREEDPVYTTTHVCVVCGYIDTNEDL